VVARSPIEAPDPALADILAAALDDPEAELAERLDLRGGHMTGEARMITGAR
jgi:hypothetical protein